MIRPSLLLLLLAAPLSGQTARSDRFDLLIEGGRILDGSGNPWFYADIGIRGGRIAEIGRLAGREATRVIKANHRIVAPGFIDIHSHADDGASSARRVSRSRRRASRRAESRHPGRDHRRREPGRAVAAADRRPACLIEKNGIGPNAMLMVGHGSVRARGHGHRLSARRHRRRSEADEGPGAAGDAEGAWGCRRASSTSPGRWSTTDEVVALARGDRPVPWRIHLARAERRRGPDVVLAEPGSAGAADPARCGDARRSRSASAPAPPSSRPTSRRRAQNYWGSSGAAIQLIERARARGVDVWADQYSYPHQRHRREHGAHPRTGLSAARRVRARAGTRRGLRRGARARCSPTRRQACQAAPRHRA